MLEEECAAGSHPALLLPQGVLLCKAIKPRKSHTEWSHLLVPGIMGGIRSPGHWLQGVR